MLAVPRLCYDMPDEPPPPAPARSRGTGKTNRATSAGNDIAAQKQAEHQPRALSTEMLSRAQKFNTVMSAVPDFIYQFDLDGRFTYMNEALLDLWQTTYEQAIGKTFHELDYPRELAEKLQRQIQQVITTRQPLRDETPYTSALGERQYEYIFSPLVAPNGDVEAVAGVTRDITERKRSEQRLGESEARFRAMFEQANVGIVQINNDGRFVSVNPGFCAIVGYTEEELCRMGVRDVTHPEDYEREELLSRRLMNGEVSDFTLEKRFLPKNGSICWGTMTATLVRGDAGTPLYTLSIVQVIGERKRAEEALRASEERFRLLVEGARDYAMFLLDPSNVITFWSSGAQRVFGWTQDEAVGRTGELIFTPEDRAKGEVEKEIATAMNEGRALDRRFHIRQDGTRFWTDGVMMRLDDDQGGVRGLAKIARDASDQRRIEDELRHARDEMEQRVVERTRDLLATNTELERTMAERQRLEKELLQISEREKRRIGEDLHDMVCQELTATALLLKSAAKKVESESRVAAVTLEESAQLVNRNVGLARDLARGLQPSEFKGAGLKQALRGLAEQACENTAMKCHFKASRGTRVTDDTIALHLYRVAQEAVKNAIKHSGAKNVLITLDHNDKNVCVSVQDDGKGFAQSRRSKGLGLHLMRYRARALGGQLKIEKRRSGGMDITCVIPLKK